MVARGFIGFGATKAQAKRYVGMGYRTVRDTVRGRPLTKTLYRVGLTTSAQPQRRVLPSERIEYSTPPSGGEEGVIETRESDKERPLEEHGSSETSCQGKQGCEESGQGYVASL